VDEAYKDGSGQEHGTYQAYKLPLYFYAPSGQPALSTLSTMLELLVVHDPVGAAVCSGEVVVPACQAHVLLESSCVLAGSGRVLKRCRLSG